MRKQDTLKSIASHPIAYVVIIGIATAIGGCAGYRSLEFGGQGVLTSTGLVLGFLSGVGLAFLWAFLMWLNHEE